MYTAILLSGGSGSRMKNAVPKQYMLLAGKPVIMHILERFDVIEGIKEIVVVCTPEYQPFIELMLKQYGIEKTVKYAVAGKTRQESVMSGLKYVETDKVIIHEAARPFVTADEFIKLINEKEENVMYGSPINYTVIKGDKYVKELLERSTLVNVQLPQKFSTGLLKKAHEKAANECKQYTEDASLVYDYDNNIKIKIIEGNDYNIKLTTPTDMLIGEEIYREYFQRRV